MSIVCKPTSCEPIVLFLNKLTEFCDFKLLSKLQVFDKKTVVIQDFREKSEKIDQECCFLRFLPNVNLRIAAQCIKT